MAVNAEVALIDGPGLGTLPEAVLSAVNLIQKDISSHIKVKRLARLSGTNECTLKRSFKTAMHKSIYQYLLQCRMSKAADLLKQTDHKEKDIAMECGYQSLAGFVTAFKKYYGVTPGQLRHKQ